MKRSLVIVGILLVLGIVLLTQHYPLEYQAIKTFETVGCKPCEDIDYRYDYCCENIRDNAWVELSYTDFKGKSGYGFVDGRDREYYIEEISLDIMVNGDDLYRSNLFGEVVCTGSGCPGNRQFADNHIIATAPTNVIRQVQFTAFDYYAQTNDWTWSTIGWYQPFEMYVLNCFDDNDCTSPEICNKAGSWDTWTCMIDPCETMPAPENICFGFEVWSQRCEHGEYLPNALIEDNSEMCGCVIQEPINTCLDFDLWSQVQEETCIEGLVLDTLIEANSDVCGCIVEDAPDICIGVDLWSQVQETPCVAGLVPGVIIETNSGECGYSCTEGETKSFKCTDGSIIVTQRCMNNVWNDVDVEKCPLNWINLEIILLEYVNDIKEWLEGLL